MPCNVHGWHEVARGCRDCHLVKFMCQHPYATLGEAEMYWDACLRSGDFNANEIKEIRIGPEFKLATPVAVSGPIIVPAPYLESDSSELISWCRRSGLTSDKFHRANVVACSIVNHLNRNSSDKTKWTTFFGGWSLADGSPGTCISFISRGSTADRFIGCTSVASWAGGIAIGLAYHSIAAGVFALAGFYLASIAATQLLVKDTSWCSGVYIDIKTSKIVAGGYIKTAKVPTHEFEYHEYKKAVEYVEAYH